MLGAPRTTVTLAATKLQNAGVIHYSRGNVRILNHKRLEKAACECYCLIRDEFDRLGLNVGVRSRPGTPLTAGAITSKLKLRILLLWLQNGVAYGD